MDISLTLFRALGLRVAEIVTLLAFAAYVAAPGGVRGTMFLVMAAACVATAVMAFGWAVRVPRRRVVAGVAAASAVGLAASVVYLRSLDPNGADIPLAGVGVLLASLGGLLGTCVGARPE